MRSLTRSLHLLKVCENGEGTIHAHHTNVHEITRANFVFIWC